MGRDFWTPLRKPSKLAPSMTMLGGLWKTIAEHTAAKAGTAPAFHSAGRTWLGSSRTYAIFFFLA
jgi:hypothetical protein